MDKIKICHLTSAHSRSDTRIYHKECVSLAKISNYDVTLIVADGKENEVINSVKIHGVDKPIGRLYRFFITPKIIYNKAININADIYHFHDPELIPIGIMLLRKGKKVIFDSHEDVPKQIIAKPYLNRYSLNVLSKIYSFFENYAGSKFTYIIAATPVIRDKFLKINKNTIDINNFPILKELPGNPNWNDKKDEICYVGGISKIRGINEIIKSLGTLKAIRLNLAGNFTEIDLELNIKKMEGWKSVNDFGYVDREMINQILSNSKAGLVTLHPVINYIESLPVKMFEYMAAGIPVIYSNFNLWKDILDGSNCGIAVNPLKSDEISNAIKYIIDHPIESKLMGENGKKLAFLKYNWGVEEKKLINTYKQISN